jgi:hypothetical protein
MTVVKNKKVSFKEGLLQANIERTVTVSLVIRGFLFLKFCEQTYSDNA